MLPENLIQQQPATCCQEIRATNNLNDWVKELILLRDYVLILKK